MYVGNRHEATAHAPTLLPFACSCCGYETEALVVGVGRGQGQSPFFLDEVGAAARARERADRAARKNADLTLSLARCPRCGARDRAAVALFAITSSLTVIGSTLLAWLVGFVFYFLVESEMFLWVFGLLGLVFVPLVYWLGVHWKWSTVADRVAFLHDGGPAKRRAAFAPAR